MHQFRLEDVNPTATWGARAVAKVAVSVPELDKRNPLDKQPCLPKFGKYHAIKPKKTIATALYARIASPKTH
jgi:hypothetical protein